MTTSPDAPLRPDKKPSSGWVFKCRVGAPWHTELDVTCEKESHVCAGVFVSLEGLTRSDDLGQGMKGGLMDRALMGFLLEAFLQF